MFGGIIKQYLQSETHPVHLHNLVAMEMSSHLYCCCTTKYSQMLMPPGLYKQPNTIWLKGTKFMVTLHRCQQYNTR